VDLSGLEKVLQPEEGDKGLTGACGETTSELRT